jgi:hypothetical protein
VSHSPATRARVLAPLSLVTVALALAAVIAVSGLGGSEAATAKRASPAQAAKSARWIRIGWAGDTVLGSRHGVPPKGGRDLLAGIRTALQRPDVMIGNLEGTIGAVGLPKCPLGTPNCFAFQAPPVAARTLAWAGFDVMNLANNHANDYGPSGLTRTAQHLEAAGLRHTGVGAEITIVRRKGISVAIVGFAPYPWAARLDDIPAAAALVRRAATKADVTVVVMHAGGEGATQTHTPVGEEIAFGERRGDTRAFAHAVVDAGADAVFGSGPHVIRGVELRRGVPITYSTGNFVGYHTFSTAGAFSLSAVVEVRLDVEGRLRGGRWLPVRLLGPGRPAVDRKTRMSTLLAAHLSDVDFATPGLCADGRFISRPLAKIRTARQSRPPACRRWSGLKSRP